jgi:hypothetical protein
MTASREQILVDMTAGVMSEATRTVVRLENDGIDGSEAIRMVVGALTALTLQDADLVLRLMDERSRPQVDDGPNDRELGGQG